MSEEQGIRVFPPGQVTGPRLSGRFAGHEVGDLPLEGRTSMGRHPANTLRLIDREVSKDHCVIEKLGTGFVLRDLGSSNGSFVNGKKVTEAKLRDGDEIVLGSSTLTFHDGAVARSRGGGVTIVGSLQSMPAFLASVKHTESPGFRAADSLSDVETLKQDYEKLRIANEFHRLVGNERELTKLLAKTLELVVELLKADNAVIFIPDATGQLAPQAVLQRKATGAGINVPETVLKRVVETRSAVLTADAMIDSRFSSSQSIVAQGIRSAMAVPLLSQGELRGVLFCDTRERTNAFSEKDLKLLLGIASQAAGALENAELAQKIDREAITRAELSRFLAPAVAEAVVSGKIELLQAGQEAEVTCLFADIRGFTTLAEAESPEETVAMLNGFLTAMAGAIFGHEGNLDKFIGDCVMATWGPPLVHADNPQRALRCALEMQEAITTLNAARVAEGKKPISVGIGVNTGPAVVGYIGSKDRHEFTAIGDSVNTASRLCDKAAGGDVLAAERTVRLAGPAFQVQKVAPMQVKGKTQGVAAYRVLAVNALTGETPMLRRPE